MAISMLDNISYKGGKPDNVRSQFATIADMVAFSENYLPEVYSTFVVENGRRYRYNKSNEIDPQLGKWREDESAGSVDLSNYYTKKQIDDDNEIRDKKVDDNTTHIGNLENLLDGSFENLVAAINKVYGVGASSFTYADKKVIITTREGKTVDIDCSEIITDTSIGEFKDTNLLDCLDGQSLMYDEATGKWVNKAVDLESVLTNAKKYTDDEIVKAQKSNAVVVDAKPTYDAGTDTVTYIENGETKTETPSMSWFYYDNAEGVLVQVRWINGVEKELKAGDIDLSNYLDRNIDVESEFQENPSDLTKIPNLNYMNGLRLLLVQILAKKINTEDIVDDLLSENTQKPLSANQGKVLKGLVDDLDAKFESVVPVDQGSDNKDKILKVNEEGKLVLVDVSSMGNKAENVSYENPNYPTQTDVKKALDALWAKVDYVKPEITAFTMTPSTTVYEVGSSVPSVSFAWTLNKDITTQSLTGCSVTLSDRTATYNTAISSGKTFTLTVGDGTNTATKSIGISFQNKVYWGSAAIPAEFNSEFVLDLSGSKFSTTNKGTYAMNVGSGEYGFLCTPNTFGNIATCWIGGFEVTLEKAATISFTNASGNTSSYNIYRTGKASLGSITMEVK